LGLFARPIDAFLRCWLSNTMIEQSCFYLGAQLLRTLFEERFLKGSSPGLIELSSSIRVASIPTVCSETSLPLAGALTGEPDAAQRGVTDTCCTLFRHISGNRRNAF